MEKPVELRVRTVFLLAFAIVVGLFGLATIVTVRSVGRVQELHERLAQLDHAKHEGHLALADIQELYIHQAHTLIEGDLSRLQHYLECHERCQDRLERLKAAAERVEVKDSIEDLELCVDEMHGYFEGETLKEIRAGAEPHGSEHSEHLEGLTTKAQKRTQQLNSELEALSDQVQDELSRLLARTSFWTSVLLTVAVAIAVLTFFVLVRMISRPLVRLHEAFGDVGAGRLETRLEPWGPSEIRSLTASFNEMVATLEENRRLIAQKERLEVMGELSAGVAHELNNPLAVITGYVKVLSREIQDEKLKGDLAIISDEVQQCQHIIHGLLQLARPQALEVHTLNICTLVQDVITRHAMMPSRTSAKISVTAPQSIEAAVDEFAIRGILTNLLTNAQDAAGDGGKVSASLKEDGDDILIAVDDSGPGLSPEEVAEIFKPFHTTKPTGVGLGLAISHALTRAHGGSITIAESELGGARFEVRIPKNRQQEEVQE